MTEYRTCICDECEQPLVSTTTIAKKYMCVDCVSRKYQEANKAKNRKKESIIGRKIPEEKRPEATFALPPKRRY